MIFLDARPAPTLNRAVRRVRFGGLTLSPGLAPKVPTQTELKSPTSNSTLTPASFGDEEDPGRRRLHKGQGSAHP